ncbi:MAG: heme biosynthesis protein [Desulfobacterales bacterium]|nr:MAG: heme biosynthesis protein [Desulfobacterales bacterium]
MQKGTVSFSRHAGNLFFHLLTQCNLTCRHCYINPDQHGRKMLPREAVTGRLGLFARRMNQSACGPNLVLLGGEPSLHPDLPAIIRSARSLGYASITVDTNGYLFHDLLNRITPAELDVISFSLDGPDPKTNDAMRGEGVFETCVAGLRRAVAAGFSTSLIYTVSRANIHELHRMPSLLETWGVDRFFIQVIGIRGNSAGSGDKLQVRREEWMAAVPPVAEDAANRGIFVSYPRVFLEKGEKFECAAVCADNYFIFPNDRVYRCPLCEDFPIHAHEITAGEKPGTLRLADRPPITEKDLFRLHIPEGCVMNRLIQPDNLPSPGADGGVPSRVACCMLKQEVKPSRCVSRFRESA